MHIEQNEYNDVTMKSPKRRIEFQNRLTKKTKDKRIYFKTNNSVKHIEKEGRSIPVGNSMRTQTRKQLYGTPRINLIKTNRNSRLAKTVASVMSKHNSLRDMFNDVQSRKLHPRNENVVLRKLMRMVPNDDNIQ
jgi:hypothetical protein